MSGIDERSILEGNKIFPVEVKAEENLQAKSLKVYGDKYNPELKIRTSMSDYIFFQDKFLKIPLYAVSVLKEALMR